MRSVQQAVATGEHSQPTYCTVARQSCELIQNRQKSWGEKVPFARFWIHARIHQRHAFSADRQEAVLHVRTLPALMLDNKMPLSNVSALERRSGLFPNSILSASQHPQDRGLLCKCHIIAKKLNRSHQVEAAILSVMWPHLLLSLFLGVLPYTESPSSLFSVTARRKSARCAERKFLWKPPLRVGLCSQVRALHKAQRKQHIQHIQCASTVVHVYGNGRKRQNGDCVATSFHSRIPRRSILCTCTLSGLSDSFFLGLKTSVQYCTVPRVD
jgi:hypothetical protein